MKAILITRCGCSRMVNVPDSVRHHVIPLLNHFPRGLFRSEGAPDGVPLPGQSVRSSFYIGEFPTPENLLRVEAGLLPVDDDVADGARDSAVFMVPKLTIRQRLMRAVRALAHKLFPKKRGS